LTNCIRWNKSEFKAARTHFLTDFFVACLGPGYGWEGKGEKNKGGRKKIINKRSKPQEVSRLASLADMFAILPRF